MCIADWAAEIGITRERLRQRLLKYSPEVALTTPRGEAPNPNQTDRPMADTTPSLDLPIIFARHVGSLTGDDVDVADEKLARCMLCHAGLCLARVHHGGRIMGFEYVPADDSLT